MERLEGLKRFLEENKGYILSTFSAYFLAGLILPMSLDFLMAFSISITFTTSITYAGFSYVDKTGLKYWIMSFLLNLALFVIFPLIYHQNPPGNNTSTMHQACKTAIQTQCQVAGEMNISVTDTCINDGSVMRDAIPYDLKEASDLNDTKVVCP